MKTRLWVVVSFLAWGAAPALAAGSGAGSTGEIAGVVSLTPVSAQSCIAAWVPLAGNQALAGVAWYNNDGSNPFPKLVVLAGVSSEPGAVVEGLEVKTDFAGPSSAWGEVTFTEPIASSTEGLYVVFVLPALHEHTGPGVGGGPALGYALGSGGLIGWMSQEGEDWVRLHPDYRLAVEPVLVEAAAGMRVMRRQETKVSDEEDETPATWTTALAPASPNPFNPRTTLRFTLAQVSEVELTIYNVRGEKVRDLLTGTLAEGEHASTWNGDDQAGRAVASGLYVARLKAGGVQFTQRLHLVR